MKLQLVSIEKQGFIRVANDGSITAADFSADGVNPLKTVLGETWSGNNVLLDFSKTNFIDSTAIGWLISTNKLFKDNGGRLIVHSIQPSVRQVLDLLRVGKTLSLAVDENDARQMLTGAG